MRKDGGDGFYELRPTESDENRPSGVRRLVANISALLASSVFERAMRFVLYALVARGLGVGDLGRLALAVAIFQVVSRLVVVGLPVLTTREVARHRERVGPYLVNGGLTVVATAVVGYAALAAFVLAAGYERQTVVVIWALFASLVPFCWSRLMEAVFIGLERAKYVAYVSVPVNLVQTAAVFFLLRWDYGVSTIAFSLTVAYSLIAAIQMVVVVARIRPARVRPSIAYARAMMTDAFSFFGIEGTIAVRSSSSTVIISLILGAEAVGVYSAAVQLQMPLRLIGNTVGTGLFPVMIRAFRQGVSSLARAASHAVELIIIVLLPGVVGLVILADELLALVYGGEEFRESAIVLQLLAVAGIAMAIASILGRALVSANQELVTLRISIVNTTVQIALAVALTARFDVIGVAVAGLIVGLLNVVQHYLPINRLFSGFPIWSPVWRPIVASAGMTMSLLVISNAPVLIRVVIGAAVYTVLIFGISLWSAGGRAGLQRRWTLLSDGDGQAG